MQRAALRYGNVQINRVQCRDVQLNGLHRAGVRYARVQSICDLLMRTKIMCNVNDLLICNVLACNVPRCNMAVCNATVLFRATFISQGLKITRKTPWKNNLNKIKHLY